LFFMVYIGIEVTIGGKIYSFGTIVQHLEHGNFILKFVTPYICLLPKVVRALEKSTTMD